MVEESGSERHGYSRLFVFLLTVAILAAIAGLWWSYHLSGRLTHAEAELAQAQQQNQKLASALDETNARLKVTNQQGQSLSARQKQLAKRARDLLKREQSAVRPENEQQPVPTPDASSATSPGTPDAKAAANAAEAQLQRIKGDAGVTSLIATNQHELDILKQAGDRDYYDFTLQKGRKQPVSTVALELRKTDVKEGRYTLLVYVDGNKIEKKDRDLNEPVQFYTGKENTLYEVVVNQIGKDQVTGYLATPKTTSAPVGTP